MNEYNKCVLYVLGDPPSSFPGRATNNLKEPRYDTIRYDTIRYTPTPT
jgi:hypothetical protein